MKPFNLSHACPPWLEDEALLIEHAGEMPEVALAESLHLLGELPKDDLDGLRAACARGYLRNIKRDLDPANPGLPAFRGLERARANLARLKRFLSGFGAGLPATAQSGLAVDLAAFLGAEQSALDQGRPYSAAPIGEVNALAGALAFDLEPWQDLLSRVEKLPAPDFIGLRTLKRLACADPAFKRRRVRGDHLLIELMDTDGNCLAGAVLPWHSDARAVASENQSRAEMVWRLLSPPEEQSPAIGPGDQT